MNNIQRSLPLHANDLRDTVPRLLQYGPDPEALGGMTDRRQFAGETELTDQAQAVLSKHPEVVIHALHGL